MKKKQFFVPVIEQELLDVVASVLEPIRWNFQALTFLQFTSRILTRQLCRFDDLASMKSGGFTPKRKVD
jgi:hypothetical protein